MPAPDINLEPGRIPSHAPACAADDAEPCPRNPDEPDVGASMPAVVDEYPMATTPVARTEGTMNSPAKATRSDELKQKMEELERILFERRIRLARVDAARQTQTQRHAATTPRPRVTSGR